LLLQFAIIVGSLFTTLAMVFLNLHIWLQRY